MKIKFNRRTFCVCLASIVLLTHTVPSIEIKNQVREKEYLGKYTIQLPKLKTKKLK